MIHLYMTVIHAVGYRLPHCQATLYIIDTLQTHHQSDMEHESAWKLLLPGLLCRDS